MCRTVVASERGSPLQRGFGRWSRWAALRTCTVNESAADVLAWASVAVHETVVVPSGNVEPDAGEQSGVTAPSTRSLAVAVYVTTVGDVASTTIGAGSVSAGAVVSVTTMSKVWVPTLPCESVAVHVTGHVPTSNKEPGAGAHDCETTTPPGSLAENA